MVNFNVHTYNIVPYTGFEKLTLCAGFTFKEIILYFAYIHFLCFVLFKHTLKSLQCDKNHIRVA